MEMATGQCGEFESSGRRENIDAGQEWTLSASGHIFEFEAGISEDSDALC